MGSSLTLLKDAPVLMLDKATSAVDAETEQAITEALERLAASLALGGPINAKIARQIACDAGVIPVVLGSRREPLDIGRARRGLDRRRW